MSSETSDYSLFKDEDFGPENFTLTDEDMNPFNQENAEEENVLKNFPIFLSEKPKLLEDGSLFKKLLNKIFFFFL
jgi:hypothetical protein